MKKLLLLSIAALLLGCAPQKTTNERFTDDIRRQLNNPTEWCYTCQAAEPVQQNNNVYIIDFYTFAPLDSYSKWVCVKEGSEVDCDLIFINYYA